MLVLAEAVTPEELGDEEEYADILDDMRSEAAKHGPVVQVVIPRPTPEAPEPAGLGLVVIEFTDANASVRARNQLHGRKFGGRTVMATYMPEAKWAARDFS